MAALRNKTLLFGPPALASMNVPSVAKRSGPMLPDVGMNMSIFRRPSPPTSKDKFNSSAG